ncbi:HAD family hydrolase [Photobacterium galatheae]|uniref:HAD family hydrolase n=1 Tax=Photobacterium galatheae TaxID=1654360 RepID=A0A066RSD5_9GAMM|nr:HAD family hydrolase [Photobacterium galatheae]KDM92026.1 hypothetical protein EA58_08405 [Photobacterium galatheae]MCM0151063.1 HAD family hydrolase [Photobacterium galatheae]
MSYTDYIFDFDGTIADTAQCGIVSTQSAFEFMGLPKPDEKMIESLMGIPIEKSFREMGATALTAEKFDQLIQVFREEYQKNQNHLIRLFPGITEVLQTLKRDGKRLFIASSKNSKVLNQNLASLAIQTYFDGVIGSDHVENYKPAPDSIFKLIQDFNAQPESTVMIGDACYDIQMAKSAQVRSCAVLWGAHSRHQLADESPDHLIENTADLLTLA